MKGAAALETMRRQGYAPSLVCLDLGPDKLRMSADWPMQTPTTAYLAPTFGDVPHRADMRCVVGLTVLVQGSEPDEVHAWRDACIAANAARVVSAVTRCTDPTPLYERFETTEIHDTRGVLHG